MCSCCCYPGVPRGISSPVTQSPCVHLIITVSALGSQKLWDARWTRGASFFFATEINVSLDRPIRTLQRIIGNRTVGARILLAGLPGSFLVRSWFFLGPWGPHPWALGGPSFLPPFPVTFSSFDLFRFEPFRGFSFEPFWHKPFLALFQ